MISRELLRYLLFGIPVLLTAAVVAGIGFAISHGVGDTRGGYALGFISVVSVLLLAADALLLLLALGVRELERAANDRDAADRNPRASD